MKAVPRLVISRLQTHILTNKYLSPIRLPENTLVESMPDLAPSGSIWCPFKNFVLESRDYDAIVEFMHLGIKKGLVFFNEENTHQSSAKNLVLESRDYNEIVELIRSDIRKGLINFNKESAEDICVG